LHQLRRLVIALRHPLSRPHVDKLLLFDQLSHGRCDAGAGPGWSTDRVERTGGFGATVDAEEIVQGVIAKAQGGCVCEARGGGCQSQVLADVPAVDQRVAVCPVGIAPAVTPEDVREDDCEGRICDLSRSFERTL
jgi:hypothetical protein